MASTPSFRAFLRSPAGNPSTAFDVFDDFSTDNFAGGKWSTDEGPQWTVNNGSLVATSSVTRRAYRKDIAPRDFEVTAKYTTGSLVAGFQMGFTCHRIDSNNYLLGRLTSSGVLDLISVKNGSFKLLATGVTGPLLSGGFTTRWLRMRVQNGVLTVEDWFADPNLGGLPNGSVTYTLNLSEAAFYEAGGGVGMRVQYSSVFDELIDDFRIHPLEVDLAPYMRVAPGEGMDPANSDYLTPEFADSPLRDGGYLVNVDTKNRETQWPLAISSSVSKDDLRAKQLGINLLLQQPGVQLEWRDDGATRSTFLDLQGGRLDEQYNFRREQRFWANCLVHVWTTPFGHTNNNRVVGTLSGSGAVQGMPLEPLGNDPSNMIQSSDFELGVLGLGSWSAAGVGALLAGGSIMAIQAIPTSAPPFLGDYVARVWADGTQWVEGIGVPFTFASGAASQLSAVARVRTPRGSYPMQLVLLERAGGLIAGIASFVIGTSWTTGSVGLNINAASLSGSWQFSIRTLGTTVPSLVFEVDQVLVTMNGAPSLSIPSILDGDQAAKAVWQVTTGSGAPARFQLGRYIGVAALPAGWTWQIPAGSIAALSSSITAPTLLGATGYQGSQYLGISHNATQSLPVAQFTIPNADAHNGRNRIYAIGNSFAEPNHAMYLADWEGNRVGPTIVASATPDRVRLYDLGVVTVPTAGRPSQLTFTLYAKPNFVTASWAAGDFLWGASQYNRSIGLNQFVILPELQHSLLVDDVDVASQIVFDDFRSVQGLGGPWLGQTTDDGHTWATSGNILPSQIPTVTVLTEVGNYGGSLDFGNGVLWGGAVGTLLGNVGGRIPSMAINNFRITTLFEHTNVGPQSTPSQGVGVMKQTNLSAGIGGIIGVKYGMAPSSLSPYLCIELWKNAVAFPSIVACVAFPTYAQQVMHRLTADFTNNGVSADLRHETFQPAAGAGAVFATVAASNFGWLGDAGDPGLYLMAASAFAVMPPRIYNFRVESIPTQRIAARDVYVLDGVNGEAYRRPLVGDIQQRLTHKLRGKIPAVPVPSTARLVAFSLGLPDGTASDAIDLQVQLREQFLFAR